MLTYRCPAVDHRVTLGRRPDPLSRAVDTGRGHGATPVNHASARPRRRAAELCSVPSGGGDGGAAPAGSGHQGPVRQGTDDATSGAWHLVVAMRIKGTSKETSKGTSKETKKGTTKGT